MSAPAAAPPRGRADMWLALALFAGALALRLYRLNADPLWLDELYGVQLGRLGFAAILGNSWFEPTPPLNHVLVWLGSGFAAARTEWAYRWTAVLGGAATVPLVYGLARGWAGRAAAAGAALVLLLSPAHLYYSQEARSYALAAGVAALSAWVLLAPPTAPNLTPPARWRVWAAVSVIGLLLNYAYVMVAGVQALMLLTLARRQAGVWPALAVVGAVVLAIAPWAAATLPASAGYFAGEPLRLWTTVQALTAGDLARYGPFWGHTWLTGGLALLAALGVWRLARRPGDGWALYAPAQLLLPLAAFFVVVRPLAGINLQLYQARQFLVLLPVALVVVSAGLEQVRAALLVVRWPRLGRWLAAGVGAALLVGLVYTSAVGLERYWGQTKSPEGWVARFVRDHGADGAAVVSLQVSLDAAFSFYVPGAAAYFAKPLDTGDGVFFADSLSAQVRDWPTMARPHSLAAIGLYPRRWLAWERGVSEPIIDALTAGCTPVPGAAAAFGPFEVRLVENCPPL